MSPMPENFGKREGRAYSFDGFRLDVVDETLWRNNEKLNINRRMFQVLLLLIEKKGAIVTKDEFFEKVWDGSFVEDNNLTVTIAALRKALEDDPKQAKFIENIPRKGYRFIAKVNVDQDLSVPDTLPSHRRSSRSRSLSVGAAAAVLLTVLSIAAVSYKAFWWTEPAAQRIESIAVLPFENKDPSNEYMAAGMAEAISASLAKIPGLRVIDRNSTDLYSSENADPQAAGRDLNVAGIVSGRIDKQSDIPIVTVNLTDIASKRTLLQQQYRLPQGDMIAVQQEILRSIAQNLNRSTEELETAVKPPTLNPEAYDLYIQGRYYWNKRINVEVVRSADLFRSAIAKDPNFAKAYIGLAQALSLGNFSDQGISVKESVSLAKSYVQKALEIDPTLSEAYAVIAIGQCYTDWEFAAADQNYHRAVDLSPNDATAHHWYAEFLSMQGYTSASFDEYAKAISLDPLSLPIHTDMALGFFYANHPDRAIDLLLQAKQMNPDYTRTYQFLSRVYRERSMFAESIDAFEQQYEIEYQNGAIGSNRRDYLKKYAANLRKALAAGGPEGFWRAVANSDFVAQLGPYEAAIAYAKLGENDQAFKFLEEAYRQHYSGLVWLKVDPEIENLRQDPRYTEMLRRVGL